MTRINNEHINSEMVIYQTDNGVTKIDVKFENETIWLNLAQISELFGCSSDNVGLHLKNIYKEGELDIDSTTETFSVVRLEGNRSVKRNIVHYDLDAVLSVGYRVSSKSATLFRQWVTERLKEYIIKGFTMDDERLKQIGGGSYWKELLDRIRDIRSSEKVMYRQVLDIYATSIDYDPNAKESLKFFKIVQNKLHYAAHGNTAAEIIYNRADADEPFMGLTNFAGEQPIKKDILIAKNYLVGSELKILNNLVSGYFDFAEIQAMKHRLMSMNDYIKQLDTILLATGEKLLQNAGNMSSDMAKNKALDEYKKYQVKTIAPVEQAYLKTLKELKSKISKIDK